MSPNDTSPAYPPATLLRRLGAMAYDGLLLLATLFVASMLTLPLTYAGFEQNQYALWYRLYLLGVVYLYFAWPWVRAGQTLGLRTWGLRLECNDGSLPGWGRSLLRLLLALLSWGCCGLGVWWALFDPQRRTWHDLGSGTRLVRVR